VVGKDGVTSFTELQDVLSNGPAERLVYYAFDLLYLDGRDLTGLPLVQREQDLEALLAGLPKGSPVHYSEHVIGNGPSFFRNACNLHLEGIVSKLAEARYRPGRGREWLKVKCVNRQEFVVGGWSPSITGPRDLGALLVGYYDGGKLIYAGKAGTDFDTATRRQMVARLQQLQRERSPFVDVPRRDARDARWVEPKLVAEVELTTWTRDGRVRHPSFKGLREDKPAGEVKLERNRR
jgi:bifunctional non-homologous end joining protein LigD